MDRHKILAVACEKYPELQLPDEFDEWMKEIERLDDYAERMMEEVRELQKVEHQCIGTNNHRELRQAQIRIREQLRKLRISVEQKSEVNSKIERFFDEFNSRLPMVYAHVDAAEPENLTLDENSTLQTPEIKQKNYEVLQGQREFADKQLKIEQVYIAANEANEPEPKIFEESRKSKTPPPTIPPLPVSTRGRRFHHAHASPQKKGPRGHPGHAAGSPKKRKSNQGPKESETPKEKRVREKNEDETPQEKKPRAVNPLPSVSAPVTRGAGRKKTIIRRSESPEEPPPKQRVHRTPEQLAAKREERARVQKEKEEQRKTAEEIQKILEQESDYPRRRAAATAAVGAIHNLQVQQARIPTIPQKVSPKLEKTVRKAYTRRSGEKKPTATTTTTIATAVGKSIRKSTTKEEEEETYCTCKQVSYGEMIACDNDDCEIVWFHFGCVNLKIKPKKGKKWYCQQCRGEKSTVMKTQ